MIEITNTASAQVRELLAEPERKGHALRLFVKGMSCSGPAYGMALDKDPRPGDAVVELDGIRVLIDSQSAPYLEGAQIDFVDSLMGRGFTVVNPNAVATEGGGCGNANCGCGHGH